MAPATRAPLIGFARLSVAFLLCVSSSADAALVLESIPKDGATDVPWDSAVVIRASVRPKWVQLTFNGVEQPTDGLDRLGSFSGSSFWVVRTRSSWQAAGEVIVTIEDPGNSGSRLRLGTFHTATHPRDYAGAKNPTLRSLRLWSVRYPVEDIGSPSGVFSEYHGFIKFEYDKGHMPDTPQDSLIYEITLVPKNGVLRQTLLFTAKDAYTGTEPVGDPPVPSKWPWDLDPTREYCLTMRVYAYSASPLLWGNTICSKVEADPPDCANGCSVFQRPSHPSSWPYADFPALLSLLAVAYALARRRRLQRRHHWR